MEKLWGKEYFTEEIFCLIQDSLCKGHFQLEDKGQKPRSDNVEIILDKCQHCVEINEVRMSPWMRM